MAATTKHWWRRLLNAYDVKAGMVCLQCNNCVIHTWTPQRRASHNGALHKSIYLPFARRTVKGFAASLRLRARIFRIRTSRQHVSRRRGLAFVNMETRLRGGEQRVERFRSFSIFLPRRGAIGGVIQASVSIVLHVCPVLCRLPLSARIPRL